MADEETAIEELCLPLGCYREIRGWAAEERFKGARLELFEGTGWLWRDFILRGEPRAVQKIARAYREALAERRSSRANGLR